jgi:Domain of unknown function (DUF4333)
MIAMFKGKGHVLAVIVTVAAGGWLVAGCSAHVSVGDTSTVPKHSVETEVATTLARQENQPVPKVVCPGDLTGKVGTVMYCSLTAQGSTTAYPVKVQVESISGTQAHFSIEVSQTPGHFTAPG